MLAILYDWTAKFKFIALRIDVMLDKLWIASFEKIRYKFSRLRLAVEKFQFGISLRLAKYYSDAISDNVKRAIEHLAEAESNYFITANLLLKLADRAYDLFMSPEVEQKRLFIQTVLSNLKSTDDKLDCELRSLF